MEKQRLTTPATKNLNSRSFFSSSNFPHNSKTPTKNSSHDVERFNFTIESKKKQSIIDKIQSLIPFLDGLIHKTQLKSVRMVQRLMELKGHIDDIFEDINEQFENANLQNQQLRQALQRKRPGVGIGDLQVQRRAQKLMEELRIVRRQKEDTQDRLLNAQNQTRQAYELLDEMKNQIERFKKMPSSDRQNYQLRSLRQELDRFKKKSIGSDENTRRRLEDYEERLRQQNKKFRELESAYDSLARKSNLGEQELLRYRKNQQDRDRNVPIDEQARRRIRQVEDGNAQLRRRVEASNEDINQKLREIRRLEDQNGTVYEKAKQFKKLSDLGQEQIRRLKSDYDNERRQSILNQQGLLRKLKTLDEQKTHLLRQAKMNDDKAKDYQKVLQDIEREFQRERRNTIENDKQKIGRIRDLQKHNAELGTQYRSNKQRIQQKQNMMRQLQEGIRQKQRKLQEYINELTKKSNLNQDQIRMLSQQLQKQRRRTLADEARIKNLESTIDDQKEKAKVQIRKLQNALEQQRRKSSADQNKIKNLQRILNQKIHLINQNDNRNVLARDELQFLKAQIEKQRRNSVVDQQKIRKLQNLLQQKEKYLNDVNNRHSIAEKDIQKLQNLIEQERRKSSADETKIRKLQSILAEKMKEANQTHNKYLDIVRKSDLGDEQIKALQNQLQNQRRKSDADQGRIRKIEQLLQQRQKQIKDQRNKRGDYEKQINFLKNQIDEQRRKSMADQQKIRKLDQMRQQKQRLLADYNKKYQDQMRITDVNAQEIKFLKVQLDKQRRKSDADENTIRNLKKVIQQKQKIAADHKNKHLNQIKFLSQQIEAQRKKSFADQAKIRKLQEMLAEKLRQDDANKKVLAQLMRKSDLNENQLKLIKQVLDEERRKSILDQNLIKKLQGVVRDQMGQLKDKENYFLKNNKQIGDLKAALQEQRNKSFVDESTIQKLQQLLKQKTEQVNSQYRKYLQSLRKSELNQQELRFLKEEMEKQRRQSALDIQGYNRKVRDLEGIKQDLTGKLDQDKRRLADTSNYIRELEDKSKNIQRLYKDANNRNSSTLQQLDKYKQDIENERRKSTALQGKFLPKIHDLVEENKRLILQIKQLKQKLEEGERRTRQLVGQIERIRRAISQLQAQDRQQKEIINGLQRQLNNADQNARRVIQQGVDELKNAEDFLHRTRLEKDRLQSQLSYKQKQTSALKDTISQTQQELKIKAQQIAQHINNNQSLGVLLNDLKRKQKQFQQRNQQLVRQNAQNSRLYESHLQNYLQGVPLRVSQTQPLQSVNNVIVQETDRRQREHLIRVLKHESKVYKLETVINRKMERELSQTSLDSRY